MTDWKPFPGLEDKYEISSDFRLRKVHTQQTINNGRTGTMEENGNYVSYRNWKVRGWKADAVFYGIIGVIFMSGFVVGVSL